MTPTTTTLKPGTEYLFTNPLRPMMAILPVAFRDVIVREINRYAAQRIKTQVEKKVTKRPRLICGYRWQDASSQEIMTYIGLLIYGMLYPQTGRRMRDAWDSPYISAWTKFMSKGRYLQIMTVLHFNDNDDTCGKSRDSLHKIRPLLFIIKKTLGTYANHGSELSFDEATMANKSSYGHFLICFNPMKPTGKFHYKIYMLCCAFTKLTSWIKVHTKDNSDLDGSETHNEYLNKQDNQTLQLCSPLFNSGCTVNMDNYFMSMTVAMKLREKGVFCRGTIRTNRKLFPKSILFTSAEARAMPRGTHRIAVNQEHQIVAVERLDNKPVHFISLADTTDIVHVKRRLGDQCMDISAPMVVANYNKFIGYALRFLYANVMVSKNIMLN
jgi:hypothetical protein